MVTWSWSIQNYVCKVTKLSHFSTIKPQRWYLSVASRGTIIDNEPGSASPRVISLSVIGEGEATGIEEIGIISHTTASSHSGLYDLQGRRLNHEPALGIYIHNGRNVVR